jgi:hypothetical protein
LNSHNWNPGFTTCYSINVIENFHRHLCGITLKVKAEAIICVLWATVSIFETHGNHIAWKLSWRSLTMIIS